MSPHLGIDLGDRRANVNPVQRSRVKAVKKRLGKIHRLARNKHVANTLARTALATALGFGAGVSGRTRSQFEAIDKVVHNALG